MGLWLPAYSTEEHLESIYWLICPNGFWNAVSWFGLEICVDITFFLFVFWEKVNESCKFLRAILTSARPDFCGWVLCAKTPHYQVDWWLPGCIIDDLMRIFLSGKRWQADRRALHRKVMLKYLTLNAFISEGVFGLKPWVPSIKSCPGKQMESCLAVVLLFLQTHRISVITLL